MEAYLTGGILTLFTGPFTGRLADRLGRNKIFTVVPLVASVVVLA